MSLPSCAKCRKRALKMRTDKANRRAYDLGVEGQVDFRELLTQYRAQNGLCFYCSQRLTAFWGLDHVVPLSRSGTSNWLANIVCACRSCNALKHDRLPFLEWQPLNPLKLWHPSLDDVSSFYTLTRRGKRIAQSREPTSNVGGTPNQTEAAQSKQS